MIQVELQFTKPGVHPLTYRKDLSFRHDDRLAVEAQILLLPFIATAEQKGWTLSTYKWEPISND